MDEAAFDGARDDLFAWGLLEGDPPAWTRRFRGAVMRAAATLAERERAGARTEGAPLSNAVAEALGAWTFPEGADPAPLHARVLVAVELAALPAPLAEMLSGGPRPPTGPSTRSS